AGRSISARDTCRKLSGLPAASARASSVLTTSYGTAATAAADAGVGRSARNGVMTAIGKASRARARLLRVGNVAEGRVPCREKCVHRRGRYRLSGRHVAMFAERIHPGAVLLQSVMEVRTGGEAGGSHQADR